jgi:hypothetical protein
VREQPRSSHGRDYTVRRRRRRLKASARCCSNSRHCFDDAALPEPFEDFTAVAIPQSHVIAVVGEYSDPDLIELGKRTGSWR